jgi:hypothetical protein
MNNKGNLLTKKKYKIVNQKAGVINEWKLKIKPHENLSKKFKEFEITIKQDSGITRGYYGNYYGLKRTIDGKEVEVNFSLYEDDFINLLCNEDRNLNQQEKDIFSKLELSVEMRIYIVGSIAFPDCYPNNFKILHNKARNILNVWFNRVKWRILFKDTDEYDRFNLFNLRFDDCTDKYPCPEKVKKYYGDSIGLFFEIIKIKNREVEKSVCK